MNKFTLAVLALVLSTGTAMSATYSPVFVESNGNRPTAGPNDDNNTPPQSVGTISAGDRVGIAGRIVNAIDRWAFTTTTAWTISFVDLDLDDQKYFDSSNIDPSFGGPGFDPADNNDTTTAVFSIFAASDLSTALFSKQISAVLGGEATKDALFYEGVAGDFILKISGRVNDRILENGDMTTNPGATYDIGIAAVPVPAAGLLLVAGIGGLGVLKRRKKKS